MSTPGRRSNRPRFPPARWYTPVGLSLPKISPRTPRRAGPGPKSGCMGAPAGPATMSLVYAIMAAGVLLLALAAGCGGGATPPPTGDTGQDIDPRAALRRAVTAVLELESAGFTLEHLKGSTALIPGFLEMQKISGVVDLPDKFRLRVEAETVFPRAFIEIRIVLIEDQAFMTDPGTGRWNEVAPESLPFTLSNLGQTLADIIEKVEGPDYVGAVRLNDFDTHHISGRVRSQDLAALVPGAGEGFDVELDLWLEQAKSLLVRVLITGKVVPTDLPDTVRRLTLDDINVPVDISPPE